MGTVGINFGSATSGGGFDVATTVASIVANLQAVETPWKNQLASLKAQDTAFTSLGTDLATLSTSLLALTDFQGVTASKLGSSSDTNILSLGNASATAAAGSHTVVVSRLAQTSSAFSAVVPVADVLSGGLTIQVGPSGTPHTIPVVSGVSDTLASYAAAITAADIGVAARVVTDATGSRLSLTSGTDGQAGQLKITNSGSTVPATVIPTAAAASVASTAYTAATNTFTLAAATDQLSGMFSYAIGTASSATINLGSTPLSLNDTAAALNLDSGFAAAGLVASVNGASLVITGASGAAGAATIDTSASSLVTTTPAVSVAALTDTTTATPTAITGGPPGQDALLNVDGISIDSASNNISGAIAGVTFQLISADPNASVQVQIVNNNSAVETAFTTFVTAYNAVVKDLATQRGKDSSGNPEPLQGNPVLARIQSTLSLALTSGGASGGVKSLYQLGLSVNQDGTLKLDGSALDSQLNSNYSDVVGYLQNANSFGLKLQQSLDQLGNESPTGAITLALAANASQEATFNSDVAAQDSTIATQKTILTAELNLANEILQAIPQQLDEVNQLYSAMTGYNAKTSG